MEAFGHWHYILFLHGVMLWHAKRDNLSTEDNSYRVSTGWRPGTTAMVLTLTLIRVRTKRLV